MEEGMDVRELPHMTERVETGAVQFGSQDWPGVFIRGDNAFNYAMHLRALLDASDDTNVIGKMVVQGLLDLLDSCIVKADANGPA
jgi:hypothetical protein